MHDLFQMIWNDTDAIRNNEIIPLEEQVKQKNYAAIDSIYYHYPKAEVVVYSNTLPDNYGERYTERGFSFKVERFDIVEWAEDTPIEGKLPEYSKWVEEKNFVVNLSDLLRLLVLYKKGGVYLDFNDTLLIKNIDHLKNAIGWEHHGQLATGVMIFEKQHEFIFACLSKYFDQYNAEVWASQGPILISKVFRMTGLTYDFDVPVSSFYPIYWEKSNLFFFSANMEVSQKLIEHIEKNTYVLHYYGFSQNNHSKNVPEDSLLGYFINKYRLPTIGE